MVLSYHKLRFDILWRSSRKNKFSFFIFSLFFYLIVVQVLEAGETKLFRTAKANSSSGYLIIETNVDSLLVIIDNDFSNFLEISSNDTILLSDGAHEIILAGKTFIDHHFMTHVAAGKSTVYRINFQSKVSTAMYRKHSSYLSLKEGVNLIVVTDHDSQVFVDKKAVGFGFVRLDVIPGKRLVSTVNPLTGSSSKRVMVQANRFAQVKMFNKPKKSLVQALAFVPGASQLYTGERNKSALFFVSVTGSILTGMRFHQRFQNQNDEYLELVQKSLEFLSEAQKNELELQTEQRFTNARNAARTRNVFWGVSAGLALFNIVDAFKKPRGGFRQSIGKISFFIQPQSKPNGTGVQYRLSF